MPKVCRHCGTTTCPRPIIKISGPGVMSQKSSDLAKTCEFKHQLKALKELSEKLNLKPARFPGD